MLSESNCDDFTAAVAEVPSHLAKVGARAAVIDFQGCGYIDSAGLGALYKFQRVLQQASCQVYIQNLNEDLQVLFELVKFDRLFPVYTSRNFRSKCVIVGPSFAEVNRELLEYFALHPARLATDLDWRSFEKLLEAVFANQGFRTELGAGYADGGIDLRLLTSDACGEIVTLVQVKKYATDNPIRLEAVQALSAVVDDRKANRGLFVTTSRYLPSARHFAARQHNRLTLADATDVALWCQQVLRRDREP